MCDLFENFTLSLTTSFWLDKSYDCEGNLGSWQYSDLKNCDMPSQREIIGSLRNDAFLISPLQNWQHFLCLKMFKTHSPTVCSNHVFYFTNWKTVPYFHSKQWLRNRHFLLIWEETHQIINKHKKKIVILALQLGWAARLRGKIIVCRRLRYTKWKILIRFIEIVAQSSPTTSLIISNYVNYLIESIQTQAGRYYSIPSLKII